MMMMIMFMVMILKMATNFLESIQNNCGRELVFISFPRPRGMCLAPPPWR